MVAEVAAVVEVVAVGNMTVAVVLLVAVNPGNNYYCYYPLYIPPYFKLISYY